MPITAETIYENGVLKLRTPLSLKEQESVTIVVHSQPSLVRQTAGMIPWNGDAETLERLACDDEFGILER